MGEVEAQTLLLDEGTCLVDMVSKHILERLMEQVRRRMVLRDEVAAVLQHIQGEGFTGFDGAGLDARHMDVLAIRCTVHGFDLKFRPFIRNASLVCDLSPACGIERRPVEDQFDRALCGTVDRLIVLDDVEQSAGLPKGVVAGEFTLCCKAGKRLGLHLHGFARFPCVPRTFTLLLHLLDEPFLIDFKAVILCIFLRQLIRESICVIEPECIMAADDTAARFRLFTDLLIYLDAFIEGRQEALLLLPDDVTDEGETLCDIRIEAMHHFSNRIR